MMFPFVGQAGQRAMQYFSPFVCLHPLQQSLQEFHANFPLLTYTHDKNMPTKGEFISLAKNPEMRSRGGWETMNGHWITPGALSYIMYSRTLWILWHKTDTLLPLLGCCAITARRRRRFYTKQKAGRVSNPSKHACVCSWENCLALLSHRKRETQRAHL
jgi:hypothetical protein